MDIKKISAEFSVSPQIAPDDAALIKAAGFVSVINNRPDGEQVDQVQAVVIAEQLAEAGLNYAHQPVVAGQISDADIAEFRQLFDTAEKPLLAFCRTGTRCTMLWALANAADSNIDELIAQAAAAGYDISGLRARMEQQASA